MAEFSQQYEVKN